MFYPKKGAPMKFSALLLIVTVTSFSVSTAMVSSNGLFTPVTGNLATSSFATGSGPDIVHFSPSGLFVATVNDADGTLSVFSVDQKSGIYTAIQTVTSAGLALDFAYSSDGLSAVVTNDTSDQFPTGSITLFTVTSTGIFVPAANGDLMASTSATQGTADAAFFPTNGFIAATEVDANQIEIFRRTTGGGLVSVNTVATAQYPFIPIFSPNGRFMTNVNQNSLTVYTVNNGSLTPINGTVTNSTFATLPNSDLAVAAAYSPDGKFFSITYQSTSKFVTVYSVYQQTGALTPINGTLQASSFPTLGFNTGLSYSPDGQFLSVTNFKLNSVTTFAVNSTTGALAPVVRGNLAQSTTLTQTEPLQVAYSPLGHFATVSNSFSNTLSAYRYCSPQPKSTNNLTNFIDTVLCKGICF